MPVAYERGLRDVHGSVCRSRERNASDPSAKRALETDGGRASVPIEGSFEANAIAPHVMVVVIELPTRAAE